MGNTNNSYNVSHDIKDVTDNTIVENFIEFRDCMSGTEIFVLDEMPLTLSKDRALAVFQMRQQYMMDDVLMLIAEHLNVNILYSYKSENERQYKVILYSLPVHDEMFIIGLSSHQYGIIGEMNVTLFSSIEIMFKELKNSLESVIQLYKNNEIHLNEIQDLTTLYEQFL